MKIEDRLSDAMHDYADAIEPSADSWDRMSARFDDGAPPRRPARGRLVFAGVAITLVIVLIAVLAIRDDGPTNKVATSPGGAASPMPSRILAIESNGHPVLLSSTTGEPETGLEASIAEGTQIAVSPDGQDAYLVTGDGNEGCADHSVLRLPVGPTARSGDQIALEASSPTVSPDGRHLAFLRCTPGRTNGGADEMVLRELATGTELVKAAPPGTAFVNHLQFGSDSRHVYFNYVNYKSGDVDTRMLDLVGGENPPGTLFADGGAGWSGVRGMTGEFLGLRGSEPGDRPSSLNVVSLRGASPFFVTRLFAVPTTPKEAPSQIVSDASGNHILMVFGDSLYRWSEGDTAPTKIADGITGAAWIPDPEPRATRAGAPSRYIEATATGKLVVHVTSNGQQVETFDAPGVDSSAPLVMTADNVDAYVVEGRSNTRCVNHSIKRIPNGEKVASSATSPTVSPDDRYLAYLRCPTGADQADQIVLRDLRNGEERITAAPTGASFAGQLQFAPDSRHVVVTVGQPEPGGFTVHVLDLVGGESAPWRAVAVDPDILEIGYLGGTGQLVGWDSGQSPTALVELSPETGETVRTLVVASAIPGPIQQISSDESGRHLLVVVNGFTLFRWDDGDDRLTKVSDGVRSATWIPDEEAKPTGRPNEPQPASRPRGVLASRSSGPVESIDSGTGQVHETLATLPPRSSVSVVPPESLQAVYGTVSRNGPCFEPGAEVGTVDLNDGDASLTPIVRGATSPIVSPDGRFVAYGIQCDGVTLGFSDLRDGTNHRTDPFPSGARLPGLRGIDPVAWAPDSKRILYRAVFDGSEDPTYWIGQLWPLRDDAGGTQLDSARFSTAAFVDNQTLAVAADDHGRSRVRFVDLRFRPVAGAGFVVPGRIERLVVDPGGRHFLAVTLHGGLYRWSRGDAQPTKLADDVVSASWIPWS